MKTYYASMGPPAKLFRKLSRRVLDKQLFLNTGFETVSGFSHGFWISCMLFQDRIPETGLVLKPGMDFPGLDQFFRIGIGFYRISLVSRKIKDSGQFRFSDLSYSKHRLGWVFQAGFRFFLSGSDWHSKDKKKLKLTDIGFYLEILSDIG
jgi:hypothetical protein